MEKLLFILDNSSKFSACENPTVLQIILFAKLFLNIGRVLLPIGLIIFVMLDFSKGLVKGGNADPSEISKLAFKRILCAVLVFCVPYLVNFVMNIMGDLGVEYSSCLLNATEANLPAIEEQYNAMLEREKNKNNGGSSNAQSIDDIVNARGETNGNSIENLSQFDTRWTDMNVCDGAHTIATSGCGYVAYTMVLRNFGNNSVIPPDIVNLACSSGVTSSAAPSYFLAGDVLNNRYGLKAEVIADDGVITDPDYGKRYLSNVNTALKNGKSLIIQMPGHYISLLGLRSDGTVIVGDSSRSYHEGSYTVESLYSATKNPANAPCVNFCGWTKIIAYSKK